VTFLSRCIHRSPAASLARGVDIGPKLAECTNGLDVTILSRYKHRSVASLARGVGIGSQFAERTNNLDVAIRRNVRYRGATLHIRGVQIVSQLVEQPVNISSINTRPSKAARILDFSSPS
jgi:hypothetical protein